MDKTEHLYYYLINPSPGKSKIVVETFPQNKFETYKVYVKIVQANDIFKEDEASTAPEWHLDYNQIASEPDKTIEYNGDRTGSQFVTLEINNNKTNNDQVLLIAVKPTNAESTGSMMDLYVASSSLQTLELDVEHWGNVQNLTDVFQLYEVFIPHTENETYVVELRQCYGSVSLYVGTDFQKMLKNEYEYKGEKLNNGKIFVLLENESNTTKRFVVSVKNTNNISGNANNYDWANFLILLRKYPKTDAHKQYVEKYIAPHGGRLDWTLVKNNRLEVTWERTTDTTGTTEVPYENVFYEAMLTTDYFYGFESACWGDGVYYYDTSKFVDYDIHENSVQIKLNKMKSKDTLYFGVQAAVMQEAENNTSYVSYYKVPYQTIKIPLRNIIQKKPSILFWIILGLIILLLVSCIIFFFRKYKKTKKRLDFEVREVRNGDFGQELQSTDNIKKYNRFTQDAETPNQDV